MIMGKYGDVIGRENPHSLEIVTGHIQKDAFLAQYHSAVFPHDHQTTEFRQTTV